MCLNYNKHAYQSCALCDWDLYFMAANSPATASAQPPQPGAALNRPLITVSIMLATLMQSLDSTIANVALP